MAAVIKRSRRSAQSKASFVLRRLAFLPVGIFLVATLSFALINLIPTDPGKTIAGQLATPGQIRAINDELGLNDPVATRYVDYLKDLGKGDLGRSYYSKRPVLEDIRDRLPATLELVILSLCVSVVVGVLIGAAGALLRGRLADKGLRGLVTIIQGIPDFFLGLLLIYIFFYLLGWVAAPTGQLGFGDVVPPRVTGMVIVDAVLAGSWSTAGSAISHAALPVLTLGLFNSAYFARTTRTHLSRSLGSQHAEFARALGLPRRRVLAYALRDVRTPILTYAGIVFAATIGGAAVVETIFSWNGIGQWTVGRVLQLDLPAVQGFVVVAGIATLLTFLVLDLAVALLDPRVGVSSFGGAPPRSLTARPRFAWRRVASSPGRAADVLRRAVTAPRGAAAGLRASLADTRYRHRGWRTSRDHSRQPHLGSLRKIPLGVAIPVAFLIVLLLAAFFAPLPHDPLKPNPLATLQAPSGEHWFGTDGLGRDVFSRTIAGARLDLPLALAGVAVSMLIGVPLGLAASSAGRWSQRFMRGLDLFQAFPLLVLAIVIVVLAGNHVGMIVVAVALFAVPQFIRLVRSDALALRQKRFVEAAQAVGASPGQIIRRHLLPNVTATVLVQASITAAQAMIVISALSFLGIGIRPPTASWGAMIQAGAENVSTGEWWVSILPGLAIVACVTAFNLIAERIEQALGRGANV